MLYPQLGRKKANQFSLSRKRGYMSCTKRNYAICKNQVKGKIIWAIQKTSYTACITKWKESYTTYTKIKYATRITR